MKILLSAGIFLVLALSAVISGPIDLDSGYFEFKWGMSAEAIQNLASSRYGSNSVKKGSATSELGYEEPYIIAKNGDNTTNFFFVNGKFYSVTKTVSVQPEAYYDRSEISNAALEQKAKALFIPNKKIVVTARPDVRGSTNSRATLIEFYLTVRNQALFDEELAATRAKGDSLEKLFIEPLKEP